MKTKLGTNGLVPWVSWRNWAEREFHLVTDRRIAKTASGEIFYLSCVSCRYIQARPSYDGNPRTKSIGQKYEGGGGHNWFISRVDLMVQGPFGHYS